MKSISRAVAVVGAVFVMASQPAVAADKDAAAFAPIHQFADGMNAGDMKKAGAAYTASASIIDEFAPHHWTSFSTWAHDAGAYFKAGGVTGLRIDMAAPSFKAVEADQAYAVLPTTLSYAVKGKPTKEKGLFTFSTTKTAAGWRITGWAWSTL